jgi:hypothetical protein
MNCSWMAGGESSRFPTVAVLLIAGIGGGRMNRIPGIPTLKLLILLFFAFQLSALPIVVYAAQLGKSMPTSQIVVSDCNIQAAINNCASACTISISSGTCNLAGTLDWAGTGKKINLNCASREDTVLTWPVGVSGISPDSHSRIAHCDLRGPSIPSAGDSIINVGGINDVVVEDNIIEGSGEHGINTGGDSLRWTIRDNLIQNNTDDGILLDSGTSDSIVSDNIVVGNGANGIDCTGSGNTIHGNVSDRNGIPGGPIDRDGILISGIVGHESANYNSVTGNETSFNGGSGITIRADSGTTANYNVVSGNVSHDNGGTNQNGDGIQVDGSDFGTWAGNAIVGNTVYNNQRFGIEVDGQNATSISTTLVSSNVSVGNGNAGIMISSLAVTDTLVVNNTVVSNKLAEIADHGTVRSVIGGNKENTSDSLFVIRGDLVVNTITSQGSNPIRLPNSQYVEAQNAANSSQVLLGLDNFNQTILRGGGGQNSLLFQTSTGSEGASMTDRGMWTFPNGMNIGQGISGNGSGLKHQSTQTGAIPPGESIEVSLIWTTSFADSDYDPQCSVVNSASNKEAIRIHHIESFGSGFVKIVVENDDLRLSHSGTIYCLGIHQ